MNSMSGRAPPGYEQARLVAFQGDEAARAALAAEAATAPEILYFLAGDQVPEVRQAVAANGATPPQADRKLSLDAQPEVRVMLGRKLAAMAPGLSAHEQDRLRLLGWETLCTLVEDAAVQVRAAIAAIIAETGAAGMKDMGKVIAALKAKHGTEVDMGAASALVKAALA
jgi:hypothetical protein